VKKKKGRVKESTAWRLELSTHHFQNLLHGMTTNLNSTFPRW